MLLLKRLTTTLSKSIAMLASLALCLEVLKLSAIRSQVFKQWSKRHSNNLTEVVFYNSLGLLLITNFTHDLCLGRNIASN